MANILNHNIACRPLVILFAKAPIAGRVKTRLHSRLSPFAAAHLQEAFVSDMVEMLQSDLEMADLELHTDVPTDEWAAYGISQKLQAPGDLGVKLLSALTNALVEGRRQVMVLGSDAPTLPASVVRELLRLSADAALGPTSDGGYYAITCRKVHSRMFENVAWSGPTALETTESAIRGCGMTVQLGSPWFDVDTPGDLDRLLATPKLPRHTAAWYESWLRTGVANKDGQASKE